MTVGGIGGAASPYTQKPSSGGGDVAQLKQQKDALQQELERVKSNNKLMPEAKEKKMDMIQKKIQRLEEAIQRATTEENKNKEIKEPQEKQSKEMREMEEKKNDENSVDVYV